MRRFLIFIIVLTTMTGVVGSTDISETEDHIVVETTVEDIGSGSETIEVISGSIERVDIDDSRARIEINTSRSVSAHDVQVITRGESFSQENQIQQMNPQNLDQEMQDLRQQVEEFESTQDRLVRQRVSLETVEVSGGAEVEVEVFEWWDPLEENWNKVNQFDNENQPVFPFETTSGAITFMQDRGQSRIFMNTIYMAAGITVAVIATIVNFIVIPKYRDRKEQNLIYK